MRTPVLLLLLIPGLMLFPTDQLHLMILLPFALAHLQAQVRVNFSFWSSMMSTSSLLPCF